MIKKFISLFSKSDYEKRCLKVLKECGCICYCPKCKDILNDQAECTDTDLVRYKCKCGYESKWNFDIAPLPILIKELKK